MMCRPPGASSTVSPAGISMPPAFSAIFIWSPSIFISCNCTIAAASEAAETSRSATAPLLVMAT